jgi:hypothetical protein
MGEAMTPSQAGETEMTKRPTFTEAREIRLGRITAKERAYLARLTTEYVKSEIERLRGGRIALTAEQANFFFCMEDEIDWRAGAR